MNALSNKIISVLFSILSIVGLNVGTKAQNPHLSPVSTQERDVVETPSAATTTKNVKATVTEKKKGAEIQIALKNKVAASSTKETVKKSTRISKNSSPSLEQSTVKENPAFKLLPTPTSTALTSTELDQKVRSALVNIICLADNEGYLRPISGTGVIIDPKGIIITNAHIGQYFLVKDYPRKNFLRCFARAGSPARETYTLELIYLPQAWIEDNLDNIVSDEPLGTGENDFALVRISGSIAKENPLPTSFPFLPPLPNSLFLYPNEVVELAGYPAGFLSSMAISQNLYITSTVGKIYDLYTFRENTADLLSLGGSIVAQKGSSGGAVANLSGNLLGLIVTTSAGKTTGERDLRAISMTHVHNKLVEYEGMGLGQLLKKDPAESGLNFNATKAPLLTKKLVDQMKKRWP